jgi:hypothetical protein
MTIKINDGLTAIQRFRRRQPERAREIDQKYRKNHREEERIRSLSYYHNHRDEQVKRMRKFREEHRKKWSKYQREWAHKLRIKAIEKLGGKCIRCGESDWRCLQFDHINGGGTKEHETNHRYRFLEDIIAGKRKDIQLLCANCNWKKKYDNNEVAGKLN